MNASKPQTSARQPDAINTSIEGNYLEWARRGDGGAQVSRRGGSGTSQ